jgi:hypothetical protein
MKYIYRGFALDGVDYGRLLKWHAAVETAGGQGCVVRALTDRHTV